MWLIASRATSWHRPHTHHNQCNSASFAAGRTIVNVHSFAIIPVAAAAAATGTENTAFCIGVLMARHSRSSRTVRIRKPKNSEEIHRLRLSILG